MFYCTGIGFRRKKSVLLLFVGDRFPRCRLKTRIAVHVQGIPATLSDSLHLSVPPLKTAPPRLDYLRMHTCAIANIPNLLACFQAYRNRGHCSGLATVAVP